MKITDARDADGLRALFAFGWETQASIRDRVAAIVADVRRRGDEALVDYTREFDYADAGVSAILRPVPRLDEARAAIPEAIAAGLEFARSRIATFHERQRARDETIVESDGTRSGLLVRPLSSIGAYVPGGTATYPSSVFMTVVPAKVAGVERVVVATPPGKDGTIDPAVCFACSLCGVDAILAAGGAQAIAVLAYGTASVAPVDKIVGPGNVYVTEAKRQVFGICGIDGLAGPSEVLVVADARSNPRYVAGEMLAQAEHDPLARVATVSRDRALLKAVAELLEGDFARETGRGKIIETVLATSAYLILAHSDDELLDVIERFAPEHLSLQTSDPWALVPRIRRAGAIFVGDDTPVAAGDYIAGSNHVLPTSGAGRFSSGLRTADFYRTMSIVENSRERMHHDRETLAALAAFEGLPAHARTALMRP